MLEEVLQSTLEHEVGASGEVTGRSSMIEIGANKSWDRQVPRDSPAPVQPPCDVGTSFKRSTYHSNGNTKKYNS